LRQRQVGIAADLVGLERNRLLSRKPRQLWFAGHQKRHGLVLVDRRLVGLERMRPLEMRQRFARAAGHVQGDGEIMLKSAAIGTRRSQCFQCLKTLGNPALAQQFAAIVDAQPLQTDLLVSHAKLLIRSPPPDYTVAYCTRLAIRTVRNRFG
jgi:hypothetical protein